MTLVCNGWPPPLSEPPLDEKKKESTSRSPKDVRVKLFVHGLVPGRFDDDTVRCGCGCDCCCVGEDDDVVDVDDGASNDGDTSIITEEDDCLPRRRLKEELIVCSIIV